MTFPNSGVLCGSSLGSNFVASKIGFGALVLSLTTGFLYCPIPISTDEASLLYLESL